MEKPQEKITNFLVSERAKSMLNWDVSNGVARRAWSGNSFAHATIEDTMKVHPNLEVTLPEHVDENLLSDFGI